MCQSRSKHTEGGGRDVFKRLATVAGRKLQAGQSGTLVNCRFSGHCSIQALAPVFFLAEEEKGVGKEEKHLFFSVFLIVPPETGFCSVARSVCRLQFVC